MSNEELQERVLELLKEENYFNFIENVKKFEKEYKESDFFKNTRMPLKQMIREAKIFYVIQLKDLTKSIQNIIDNLNLDNINEILDQMGGIFSQENGEILDNISQFKDLVGELNSND